MSNEIKVALDHDMINAEQKFEREKDKSVKVSALGIDVDISSILGEKIIDQVMARLTPEQMNELVDYVISNLFVKNKYDPGKIEILDDDSDTRRKESSFYGRNPRIYLSDVLRSKVSSVLSQNIVDECIKIIETDEYKEKAKEIAEEIVEYATEGYKKDMKTRIYERMVNDTISSEPMYNHVNLRGIIQEEIYKTIHL